MPPRLAQIHDRFDRMGVNEWAAAVPGKCCHNSELTAECYTRVFGLLKRAGCRRGKATLTDLGAGCGRGIAHAVGCGAFASASGIECVPLRVEAGCAALRDLKLSKRAFMELGSFCDPSFQICSPCAFSFDIAFDRPTLQALALKLNEAAACCAFVSFKPPGRWEAAGLRNYSLDQSGRVRTSGEERFTFFIYKKN